jgi:hypothetical protein
MIYRYNYSKAKRRGKKDGRNWKGFLFFKKPKDPFPPDNYSDHAPFERELKEAADSEIRDFYNKWTERDRELKASYCETLKKYRDADIQFKNKSGSTERSWEDYQKSLEGLRNLGVPELSSFWKYFWLIIIGLAEFPLNGIVFSIFGAGRIETYIMAGAMCIVIPVVAHLTGETFKQKEKEKARVIISIIAILAVTLALIVVAVLRAAYLAEMFKELGVEIISPTLAGIIFVFINLLIFVGAFFISYTGSHPEAKKYAHQKKLVKDKYENYLKEKKEEEQARENLTNAYKQLQIVIAQREAWCKKWRGKAEKLKEIYEQLAQVYRTANIESRNSKTPPVWYTLPFLKLDIEIPEPQNLDWNCKFEENENLIRGVQR